MKAAGFDTGIIDFEEYYLCDEPDEAGLERLGLAVELIDRCASRARSEGTFSSRTARWNLAADALIAAQGGRGGGGAGGAQSREGGGAEWRRRRDRAGACRQNRLSLAVVCAGRFPVHLRTAAAASGLFVQRPASSTLPQILARGGFALPTHTHAAVLPRPPPSAITRVPQA